MFKTIALARRGASLLVSVFFIGLFITCKCVETDFDSVGTVGEEGFVAGLVVMELGDWVVVGRSLVVKVGLKECPVVVETFGGWLELEAGVVETLGGCLDLEVVIRLVLSWLAEASLTDGFLLASSPALTRILFSVPLSW